MTAAMEPVQQVALSILIATLLLGVGAALATARLPSLRSRIAVALALATVVPFAALVASGAVRLHDVPQTPLLLVSAGAVVIAGFSLAILIRGVSQPLRELERTASRVAAGDLSARAERTGLRETDALASAFDEMALAVERLFDARAQLVSWASHDLRTPLASMQAMLEAVEDGIAGPEEYRPQMMAQVARMTALAEDLLAFATLDARVPGEGRSEVAADALLRVVAEHVGAQAGARGVTVTCSATECPPMVCNAASIERALVNIAANAVRHAPPGGAVELGARLDGDVVVLSVDDDGPGVPARDQGRVLEPFYRGDRARSSDGTGLGLAIADGLVRAGEGRIDVCDGPLGGARFTVRLPAGHAPAGT
ncbi:MAG: HAMP domain-containing sensor histidine kinase [Baekduia sp.]